MPVPPLSRKCRPPARRSLQGETGANSQAETPAPAASPPPKQSDAELETITVKPSHKTPRTTTVARKPAPGASAGVPGGEASSVPTTVSAPVLNLPESAWGPVDGFVATRSATGIKTDTPIVEIPQSISVITADRMEQLGANTLSEALNYTAGVRSDIYGSDSRYDWLSIRGFDAYFPGFYFDGLFARNNNTWAAWKVEPYGAERIEVLKGPSSVLYGQMNPGGLVNVVTKRPKPEPFGEVGIQIGNFDRVQPYFDIGGNVTEDGKVLYRFTGLGLSTDTQVDYVNTDQFYVAPGLTFRLLRHDANRARLLSRREDRGDFELPPCRGVAVAQSQRPGAAKLLLRRAEQRPFRPGAMGSQLFLRASLQRRLACAPECALRQAQPRLPFALRDRTRSDRPHKAYPAAERLLLRGSCRSIRHRQPGAGEFLNRRHRSYAAHGRRLPEQPVQPGLRRRAGVCHRHV